MSRCKLQNTERKSNTHHGSNRIEPGSNQTVLDVWCKKLDSGHILLRQDDYRWIGSCGPSRACLSSCHGKSFNQKRQLYTITRRLLPSCLVSILNRMCAGVSLCCAIHWRRSWRGRLSPNSHILSPLRILPYPWYFLKYSSHMIILCIRRIWLPI